MTPKEKAEDLVDKQRTILDPLDMGDYTHLAKQCALICVEEIMNSTGGFLWDIEVKYWQQVKQEIEKL